MENINVLAPRPPPPFPSGPVVTLRRLARSSAEAFRPVMLTPCEKAFAERSVGVGGAVERRRAVREA